MHPGIGGLGVWRIPSLLAAGELPKSGHDKARRDMKKGGKEHRLATANGRRGRQVIGYCDF
jgi:hypothetical protein